MHSLYIESAFCVSYTTVKPTWDIYMMIPTHASSCLFHSLFSHEEALLNFKAATLCKRTTNFTSKLHFKLLDPKPGLQLSNQAPFQNLFNHFFQPSE
ncbi:hypothetical protein Csa_022716 [Cucumis sativus]|uniref:Uncharacterized protein n=1 Tax=Cucumis sativus TaxID=3659 RepID=A0A0A0LVK6_CUCSA|nr:hypothetical protein Csa_022716 [Cucumis sativus]